MKALVILGPTAAGKSSLALEISERYGGEIVCIDSRTVYRRIDIGTAKPTASDRNRINHHMLDLLELDQKCDAVWFADQARESISDIARRGKLPVLVGGAGFYLRAVLHGFFDITLDPAERKEFASKIKDIPTDTLHRKLAQVDRESAERIHSNDRYRITRALEIYHLTGTRMSKHIRDQREDENFQAETIKVGLNTERKVIHERINARTSQMIENGWIREVQSLLEEGVDPGWPGMQTIGYQEIISYLSGIIALDESIERIAAATRQYAKRQLTWFRKEDRVKWLDIGENDLIGEISMILDKEWANW